MADQNNTPPAGEQGNTPPAATPTAGKTFTQAELDQHINDRLARERQKYADYDDLKKAKGELDQIKAGQLSETEKLTKRATDAEAKAQQAEVRVKEITTRAEIERQARKLNIADDDAAYRLLDVSKIEYDGDGKPTNADALLKDLVKARPYLVAQQSSSSGNPTNPPRSGGDASDPFTAALYRGAGLPLSKG